MELDANWMNKLESSDTFPFVELLITSNSHQLKYLASHLSLHNVHKFFLMVKHITNFIPEHYMDFHGKPTACCSQFDLTLARRCLCCIQLHTVHLSMLGCAACVHCFLSIDWSLFSYFSPSVQLTWEIRNLWFSDEAYQDLVTAPLSHNMVTLFSEKIVVTRVWQMVQNIFCEKSSTR